MVFVQQQLTEQVDSFVVALASDKQVAQEVATWNADVAATLQQYVKAGDVETKVKAITTTFTFAEGVKTMTFAGIGKKEQLTFEKVREVFGRTVKSLKQKKAKVFAIALDSFTTDKLDELTVAHALGEAIELSAYDIVHYKSKQAEPFEFTKVVIVTAADAEEVMAALEVGRVFGRGTNSARTLVNMPPNVLNPAALVDYSVKLAEQFGFESEILTKAQLEELGMGSLLAVNRGSHDEAFMITLKYQGRETWDDVLTFVGKGLTYDSGGYSIKTKTGMVGMKGDMAGAAAVLGALEVIGELRPEINVMVVIPTTDNMISGDAMKVDDVITSYSGKTIEVLNTDAEGRLALCDALTYAKQQGATKIVDVATLTGGVITALGLSTTGAMTNDEAFFEEVAGAAIEAGELMWRLPLTESEKERVKNSAIADLNNSPGGEGHAILGGAFLAEFVEETPWVHLDIAGTADTRGEYDLGPKGGTGVMVRTLATLAQIMSEEE